MIVLPQPVIVVLSEHVSENLTATALKECQACFQQADYQQTYLSLVSVGGMDNQDLPMSGNLQACDRLLNAPVLQYLLSGISQLGRTYLWHQHADDITPQTILPLYQNNAHPLFYQTYIVVLNQEYQLVIEKRHTTELILHPIDIADFFDRHPLHSLTRSPEFQTANNSLDIAGPRLDILSPTQLEHYFFRSVFACNFWLKAETNHSIVSITNVFYKNWVNLYRTFGRDYSGEWAYQAALNQFRTHVAPALRAIYADMPATYKDELKQVQLLVSEQLNLFPPPPRRINRKLLLKARRRKQFNAHDITQLPVFERPVFIVSTPRAGSTLLFEMLSRIRELWSTGEENHALIEDIPGLHPRAQGFSSNRLTAEDATPDVKDKLLKAFVSKLQTREQEYFLDLSAEQRPATIRFLEKTPKNALRIPFLQAVFPDALFIYLQRQENPNVSSMIDGWRSQRFIAYKNLPGFEERHWSFLLTPEWQTLHSSNLAAITTHQYQTTNLMIKQDLAQLPEHQWIPIAYEELIQHPASVIKRLTDFIGLEHTDSVQMQSCQDLPVSRLTLSSPHPNKWRKHNVFFAANEKI